MVMTFMCSLIFIVYDQHFIKVFRDAGSIEVVLHGVYVNGEVGKLRDA